eukprot:gene22521-28654_t
MEEYEQQLNDKDSEILDLKVTLRALEHEKVTYLNDFKRNGNHNDDEEEYPKSTRNPVAAPNVTNLPVNLLHLSEINPVLPESPPRELSNKPQQRHSQQPRPSPQRHSRQQHPQHRSSPSRGSSRSSHDPQLNNSFSDDEGHHYLRGAAHRRGSSNNNTSKKVSRSPFRSDDEDEEDEEHSPAVPFTVRRTASTLQHQRSHRQQNLERILQDNKSKQHNTTGSGGDFLPPVPPTRWEEGRKHEHLFTEAKVLHSGVGVGGGSAEKMRGGGAGGSQSQYGDRSENSNTVLYGRHSRQTEDNDSNNHHNKLQSSGQKNYIAPQSSSSLRGNTQSLFNHHNEGENEEVSEFTNRYTPSRTTKQNDGEDNNVSSFSNSNTVKKDYQKKPTTTVDSTASSSFRHITGVNSSSRGGSERDDLAGLTGVVSGGGQIKSNGKYGHK